MNQSPSNSPITRLGGTAKETDVQFGPLAGLIGTWTGNKGWNLVAVPNQKNGFILLTTPYTETLTVTPLSTPTPNRGEEIIQEVPTLMYNLTITSNVDGSLLHAENGTWLLLNDCPDQYTIARLASIPHGNSLLTLGNSTTSNAAPVFPVLDAIPTTKPVGAPPLGYFDPYSGESSPVPGLNKSNPNATLAEGLNGLTVNSVTELSVSTANNGSIGNIPFIQQNANTTLFNATYWLESVTNDQGQTFMQLQYSQYTVLEFLPQQDDPSKLVQWPHININTLVKQ